MKQGIKYTTAMVFMLLASTTTSIAQSCLVSGVPVVNAATKQLGVTVTAYMNAGTAQLVALHEIQTEALISALKTGVAQQVTSSDQIATTVVKSNEATASAYVASDQAMQIMEETERYTSLGYSACGIQSTAKNVYAAYKRAYSSDASALSKVRAKPGVIADAAPWYDDVLKGKSLSAQALMSGDDSQAAEYINAVMGPPDEYRKGLGGQANSGVFLSEKLRRDSRKSVAMHVMNEIAKERNASNGIKAANQKAVDAYLGNDGGASWAASMAASHERGILLDAVRIEAANIAALVSEIRAKQKTELVIATYALERSQKIINGGSASSNGPAVLPVSASAN